MIKIILLQDLAITKLAITHFKGLLSMDSPLQQDFMQRVLESNY